ncbi:hypothetical protein LSCM1_07574 [Leishmania martiniquensis]|uniref:Leucine-rich repeat protein n=1 Tax=Leishmania martiniquensis TaxID=1580590 RepID=A0A836H458_9TRYP|nr:hypothetical protein LSCM1_07574 [Leishmania martiniquensis]
MASTHDDFYQSDRRITSEADARLTKVTALSSQSLAHFPTPPPARAPPAVVTAAVAATPSPSTALGRYRAKLEECAELHHKVEELTRTNEVMEQRLASCQAEGVQLRQALHRLECVLQLRNEELVLLREDRCQRGGGGGGGDGELTQMRMIQPATMAPAQSLAIGHGRVGQEIAQTAEGAAAADQAVIMEYVSASCYLGCPTHPQLIQRLFAAASGEALIATEPPLTYEQSSVLHRLLARPPSGGEALTTAVPPPLSAFHAWASKRLRTFSVRFEDAYAGVSILSDALLHSLPSLTQLEVWCVGSDAALVKLTDSLMGATQVHALSLPELAAGDEGLQALWRLLRMRSAMVASCTTAEPAAAPCPDSLALELCTLDLSACHVEDTLTLTQLYCPSAEVLLLPPTERLTDSLLSEVLQRCPRLHTLDVSGCVRLTDACVDFFNAAPQLRVLALEHCPHVHRLQLSHVEVLLSSLAHVHTLTSRSLRVLPLPVQQRAVFTSLTAPHLSQICLHGLSLDEEVLRRLNGRTGEGDGCDEGVRLTSVAFSECTFASDDVLIGLLASQKNLQQLRLYHCRGLSDACWTAAGKRGLPVFTALHTLELINLRTLTDAALRALIHACPSLQHLNLHGAGWSDLTDASIRQLDQLAGLRVLNLLALNPNLVTASVVTALVRRLPRLQRLYHETASTAVGHSESVESDSRGTLSRLDAGDLAPASVPAPVMVERSDAEARWQAALRDYPVRLLRLQHHSALVLWTDRARTAASSASRERIAEATCPSGLPRRGGVGHDGSSTELAGAVAAEPSKLFPAMVTRTMAAAMAASVAWTTTLPPLTASAASRKMMPVEASLDHVAGAPHESAHLFASPRRDAAPLSSVRPFESVEPVGVDADECGQVSLAPEQQKQQQLHSPSSCSSSSSGSSACSEPLTQESSHEGVGRSIKRSLLQCANAATAAAAQTSQRRPIRLAMGANCTARPSATAAAAVAVTSQACTAETVEEAPMGPWEE